MDSIFLVKDPSKLEERTFYRDDVLPPLPLPSLNDTVAKYLESCKPVLNEEEYKRTVSVVEDFVANEGKRLHKKLEEKSKAHKNWLDDWWLDGYLFYRGSSAALNFTGISRFSYWPFDNQLESFALKLHMMMKFWKILTEEKLRQQTDAKGNPFSMQQYRSVFNACRIPHHGKDELAIKFKTKYEGDCPSHIIIFYKYRVYKIQGICKTSGKVFSPSQFYKMIMEIIRDRRIGPGIACLTELKRDEWASARTHLIDLSRKNQEYLEEIETAAFCACLTEKHNQGNKQLLEHGMFETSGLRWMDKINVICSHDKELIIHTDHTPLDGMVIVTMLTYFEAYLLSLKRSRIEDIWGDESMPEEKPIELIFKVDEKIKDWIRSGSKITKEIGDGSEVETLNFAEFGKADLKKFGKIHPCAFAQVCMQYAYMKMHGKPASTYETATTRIFYRGRTETLRTCTNEAVRFCQAMIANQGNKKNLFVQACQAYYELMEECKLGRGCDRHLLGLSLVAAESGEQVPAIFTDPSFTKSGGGGNFILSTSFVGYGIPFGAVLPFREDGYGVYYKINNNSMMFVVTAYRSGPYTSASRLAEHLKKALIECYNLLDQSSNL